MLLGPRDQQLRLFLGVTEQRLALLDHLLRLVDLVGDGDPDLVEDVEQPLAIDNRATADRHALGVRNQLLDLVDVMQEIHRLGLPSAPAAAVPASAGPPHAAQSPRYSSLNFSCSAATTPGGTRSLTSRPKPASSRTREALSTRCSIEVMRNTESTSGAILRFMIAMSNS